jgi:hypothetical protein
VDRECLRSIRDCSKKPGVALQALDGGQLRGLLPDDDEVGSVRRERPAGPDCREAPFRVPFRLLLRHRQGQQPDHQRALLANVEQEHVGRGAGLAGREPQQRGLVRGGDALERGKHALSGRHGNAWACGEDRGEQTLQSAEHAII